MCLLTETDSADAEETEISVLAATQAAAVVTANLELGLRLLFIDQCLFCHSFSRRYRIGSRGFRRCGDKRCLARPDPRAFFVAWFWVVPVGPEGNDTLARSLAASSGS